MVNYVQQLQFSSLLRDIDSWMDWLEKEDQYDLPKVGDESLVSFLFPSLWYVLFETFYLLKLISVYFQGCYVLYTSPISKIAFRLISRYQMDRKIFSDVTLGNCDSKVEQLKLVANTLWRHAGIFFSHEMNPWYFTYSVNTKNTFVLLFEIKKRKKIGQI